MIGTDEASGWYGDIIVYDVNSGTPIWYEVLQAEHLDQASGTEVSGFYTDLVFTSSLINTDEEG